MFRRRRQVVRFAGIVVKVEQHFRWMAVKRQRPHGVGVVSAQHVSIPRFIGGHTPLVVIAHGELTVRQIRA